MEEKAAENPVLLDWNFPGLRREKYKMSWEHFEGPQSKEVLGKQNKTDGSMSIGQRALLNGFQ